MAFILSSAVQTSHFVQSSNQKCAKLKSVCTAVTSMKVGDMAKGAKKVLVGGALVVCTSVLMGMESQAAIFQFSGERPTDLGISYGRYLKGCPTTPNCISSSANAFDKHYVPGWTYNNAEANKPHKSMDDAVGDLTAVLQDLARATIIESKSVDTEFGQGYYVYAEFESKIFGFVDDVEFYLQPKESSVEYRSASRIGESDFDVNRKRIRDIRVALQQLDNRWASLGY